MVFLTFLIFSIGDGIQLERKRRSVALKDKEKDQPQQMLRSSDVNEIQNEDEHQHSIQDQRASRAEQKEFEDHCENHGSLEDVLERVQNLANLKETSLCAAQQNTYQFIAYDYYTDGWSCKTISTVCNLNANLVSLVLTGDQRPDHVLGSIGACNYDDIDPDMRIDDYVHQDRFQDGHVHVHVFYLLLEYTQGNGAGGTIPHIFVLLQQGDRGLMVQSYVSIYDMKTFLHHSSSSRHSRFKYFDSMHRNFGGSQIHNIEHFTNHIDHARSRPGAINEGWALAEEERRRKLACLLWDNMFSGEELAVNRAGCDEQNDSELNIKISVASNPVCKSLEDIDTELQEMSHRHCKVGKLCKHEQEWPKDREGWPVHPKKISEVWKEREKVIQDMGGT